MTARFVTADPYPWPYNGDLRPQNTALVVIDMQTDFCGIGGYVEFKVDTQGPDAPIATLSGGNVQRETAAASADIGVIGRCMAGQPAGPSPGSGATGPEFETPSGARAR